MSEELDYFPPNTTKWKWGSKALNYSPWICNLLPQVFPNLYTNGASVKLIVDILDGVWKWRLESYYLDGTFVNMKGDANSGEEACNIAETKGEQIIKQMFPKWAITALKNKWRPPSY